MNFLFNIKILDEKIKKKTFHVLTIGTYFIYICIVKFVFIYCYNIYDVVNVLNAPCMSSLLFNKGRVLLDVNDGEDADSNNFETNGEVCIKSWVARNDEVIELLLSPPVAEVVRGGALEVSRLEIKIRLLAYSTELGVRNVEFLEAQLHLITIPAANDDLATRTGASEHLLEYFVLDVLGWEDAKRVHAHTYYLLERRAVKSV